MQNNRTRATCGTEVIVSLSALHLSHDGAAGLAHFKKLSVKEGNLPKLNNVVVVVVVVKVII